LGPPNRLVPALPFEHLNTQNGDVRISVANQMYTVQCNENSHGVGILGEGRREGGMNVSTKIKMVINSVTMGLVRIANGTGGGQGLTPLLRARAVWEV